MALERELLKATKCCVSTGWGSALASLARCAQKDESNYTRATKMTCLPAIAEIDGNSGKAKNQKIYDRPVGPGCWRGGWCERLECGKKRQTQN